MKNECCGNCKHFNNEDVEGWGWCSLNKTKTHCAQSWDCHNDTLTGWTEITPNNVEELYDIPEDLLIVAFKFGDTIYYQRAEDMRPTFNDIAKAGGYYYFVLPELKIDNEQAY